MSYICANFQWLTSIMRIEQRINTIVKIGRIFSIVVGLSCFIFTCAPCQAERLPVKTYTVADGLPRDLIQKIIQDSRGFLWFCTNDGISRFDGYGFTNFTTYDGLPDRHINDFLETRNGTIWIATDRGLAKLNPTGLAGSIENPLFTTFLPDNPRAQTISVLFEDESGTVNIGTEDGLYRLSVQDELESVNLGKALPTDDGLVITSIIKDRHGGMWIGTADSGLFRILPSGQVEQFTIRNGLSGNSIASLIEDKDGRIWVGLRPGKFDDGLCLLVTEPQKNQNIVERIFTMKDGLPAGWITALYQSSDTKFWVATTGGLCLWQGENDDSVCKNYTAKNDLCDLDVWTITEDKDKNLWVGSQCGAKKWTQYGFTTYTEADGTGYPITNSLFENTAGELFASFNDGRERTISRFDGEKFESIKPIFPTGISYFGWGWKQTVLQDQTGDWWMPSGGGLFRYSKPAQVEDLARKNPQKVDTGAESPEVFRIFEDSHSDIWISTTGTSNELLRWDRDADTWHNFTEELSLSPKHFFTTFVEDQEKNLWIGTGSDDDEAALIRYRDGVFKVFTQAEGVPAGWMRDLFIDHAGKLWIANPTAGLLRLNDINGEHLNFVRYTPEDGLSSIAASCITEDEFGRIYVGTGRGIDRLTPENGQVEHFTTADGLPNSNVDVAYRDIKNNLWFGTSDGLARYIPEPRNIRRPPNAFIMGLHVSGVAQSVSILGETAIQVLELNSDQRQVTVDFIGLGSSLGEHLRYEYRLDDSVWTATTERTVNFANLGSGDYQFEVRAQTADRLYSVPAIFSFRIAAPVWQRWWFIAGLMTLTAFLLYVFYRYRVGQFLELERIRTRLATDLHDDIGANLTRIALLSEVASQTTQAAAGNGKLNLLSSIAEIARESVASMNDIVWAIGPDHDSLLDLTRRMRQHAEEVFTFRDIALEFNAPAQDNELKLSVGIRRDLLLIFKEAVNNSVRHSACTKVWIDFHREDSILSLRIEDNGKGFTTDSESDGQGLRSMTRRALAHGVKLKIDSNEGEGTTVEFVLTLSKHNRR